MSVKKLLKGISEYETKFLESKPNSVKIICHRGPDGIIGASLLIKYCLKNEIDFVVSTLKILDYESAGSSLSALSIGSPSAAVLFLMVDITNALKFNLNQKEIDLHTNAIQVALNNTRNGEIVSRHNG